jgi:glycosyltransferase involved in cell wall biosynthesis
VKISICIPVFNWDVRPLVNQLHRQAITIPGKAEIILSDDASQPEFRQLNQTLEALPGVSYHQQEHDLGRAANRNFLARQAQGEFIVFLDCDMLIGHPDFLERYVAVADHADVVVGGLVYPRAQKDRDNPIHLRYRYGIAREEVHSDQRNNAPFASFMTGNFMIRRTLVLDVALDETIRGYGHEDTLLGKELERRNVRLIHIPNPALHMGIDADPVFLEKTRNSIRNLALLYKAGKLKPEDVRLLDAAVSSKARVKRIGSRLLAPLFNALPPLSRKLWLFDAWRLRELMRRLNDPES